MNWKAPPVPSVPSIPMDADLDGPHICPWGCGYSVKLCTITCEPWMRRFLYTSESSPLSGRHCGDQELKSSVFWPGQNRPNVTDQVIMLRLMSAQLYGQ